MKYKYLRIILSIPFLRDFIHFLKRKKLKTSGVSYFKLFQIFGEELRDQNIIERANNVAFHFTLAIFPAIIFLFTLIPELPIENLTEEVMTLLESTMPASIYAEAETTIEDILSKSRGGLLSVGFIFALYFATNGTTALINAFNRTYRTKERRSFLRSKLVALSLTFLLAFVLFTSIILLIVAQLAINYLESWGLFNDSFEIYLFVVLRFLVVFFLFQIAISVIYYIAPAVQEKWHFFNPGSILATLLCLAASFGFSFYINNFGTYNKLYGSIGALIALMIWFSFLSLFLIVGLELNVSLDHAKKGKPLK
ncbi:YihY/virulence factor BrkB family protein [Marivirga sp. S37H4]|uniref:YihY/virulence factor BrkB family protein n=1 Tax=Marivirga aurantiaca TaxID=2802615 RepID=A0A934X1I4_9BACT|nr:YihY/virulence factor BrkB family protein [Marivirga aurantiaca]MBK6266737.1 YihY/virulence factor BrkB family protein [Marivirga aurantiaca]